MNEQIKKIVEGKDEYQAIWEIGRKKDAGLLGDDVTWPEIAEVLNHQYRVDELDFRDSSSYRKRYRNYLDAYEQIFSKENFSEGQMSELEEQKRELEKAKIKLRDERIDYQKSLREDARRESFIELVERAFAVHVKPLDYVPSPIIDSNEDMVVCLSDLHAGIEVNNWLNQYDTGILASRLCRYLNEIKHIQDIHKCKVCNVVLGGDMVSGLIHNQLRLQNNENVIEQVKVAVTYIGDFIANLQGWFEQINVYSISGNHSRISPNKEDHLRGEELDDIIPFCLKLQFAGSKSVFVNENTLDSTINCFRTRGGKLFYIVHGDKDTPANVVQNLTLMTGIKPDGIIMNHRHHNGLDSKHNVKIIQCGCTVGSDDYCVDKRISGRPEQCVFITNDRDTVKCLYDIGLN